jgi:hypothetical protein
MKRCTKCKEFKVKGCFNKDKRSVDKLAIYCKECRSKLRTLAKEKTSLYNKKYRITNLEKEKEKDRANNLKSNFGISIEDWNKMYEMQNKMCKLCNKQTSSYKKRLCVDHCHKTGKIRGLLCDTCNRALGLLNDDTSILKKAIAYLENTEVEDKKPLR